MLINRFPQGTVKVPASKSISHRALICAFLAQGQSLLTNLAHSKDIEATMSCLSNLGSFYGPESGGLFTARNEVKHSGILDCGESGTTLRFLIPLAAMLGGEFIFHGWGRLLERPMEPFVNALGKNGALLQKRDCCLSLSGKLTHGEFELPGDVSSQFVSGLLLVLPLLKGNSVITVTSKLESSSYVDLTLDVMESFGVTVENDGYRKFVIHGGQSYKSQEFFVEADYSQAAFFLTAAALGCNVSCEGLSLDSLQGDKKIIDILKDCGAQVDFINGEIFVKARQLKPITVNAENVPDLVPVLAVLLSFCKGRSYITNAKRLRMKESDRLNAIATELNKMGSKITETEDSLIIDGVDDLSPAQVDSHNDHRIAMALAVAAIKAGHVNLTQPEAVNKSYPKFWDDFCRTEAVNS